jgi:hypothetical protein
MELRILEGGATVLALGMSVVLHIVVSEARVRLEGKAARVTTQLRMGGEVMLKREDLFVFAHSSQRNTHTCLHTASYRKIASHTGHSKNTLGGGVGGTYVC